jgi:hypothetical protein
LLLFVIDWAHSLTDPLFSSLLKWFFFVHFTVVVFCVLNSKFTFRKTLQLIFLFFSSLLYQAYIFYALTSYVLHFFEKMED